MDKLREQRDRSLSKIMLIRFLKALCKATIIYVPLSLLYQILEPFEALSYGPQTLSTTVLLVYISFIFIIEMAHGTIIQHAFSLANSLVVIFYFAQSLETGMIRFTMSQLNFTIDPRFFLGLFVVGGLLGFAKNMLGLLNWINEREEKQFI